MKGLKLVILILASVILTLSINITDKKAYAISIGTQLVN